LQKAEYWILESVVEAGRMLPTLRPDAVEEAFNRKGHGLSDVQLLETLYGLFLQGYLSAEHSYRSQNPSREKFVPSHDQLQSILEEWQQVWYDLTPKGGAVWERLSRPNWQRFIHSSTHATEPQCTVYCANRQRIEDFLGRNDVVENVLQETVWWERKEPWKVTNWKTLAYGYEVYFEYRDSDDPLWIEPPMYWYTKPWFSPEK